MMYRLMYWSSTTNIPAQPHSFWKNGQMSGFSRFTQFANLIFFLISAIDLDLDLCTLLGVSRILVKVSSFSAADTNFLFPYLDFDTLLRLVYSKLVNQQILSSTYIGYLFN